jgi:hypothetical protein
MVVGYRCRADRGGVLKRKPRRGHRSTTVSLYTRCLPLMQLRNSERRSNRCLSLAPTTATEFRLQSSLQRACAPPCRHSFAGRSIQRMVRLRQRSAGAKPTILVELVRNRCPTRITLVSARMANSAKIADAHRILGKISRCNGRWHRFRHVSHEAPACDGYPSIELLR